MFSICRRHNLYYLRVACLNCENSNQSKSYCKFPFYSFNFKFKMSKIDEGFEKAGSDNLPMVDSEMVNDFFTNNVNFVSAEVRNVKTQRSTKETYGDKAISYVQLRRNGDICTVKAKITPEHKIHKKAYTVIAVINEKDEKVISNECLDCPASQGGCKHGVAFLLWIHRRSEEPSVTSKVCYWKSSSLSKVGRMDFNINSILPGKVIKLDSPNPSFLKRVVEQFSSNNGNLFTLFHNVKYNNISLHQLALRYRETGTHRCVEDFHEFVINNMTDRDCREAESNTREQSLCHDWFELRYGRITASVLYESARCKTNAGSLVEKILGASPPIKTEAVNRGKMLEPLVIKEVSRLKKIKINTAGLFLKKEHPIFGASPDGISTKYVIEVKCPYKQKSVQSYIRQGEITNKFYYQIQLQMLFCGKNKGLFCVASPKFEEDKKVEILEIHLNKEKVMDIMDQAEIFWNNAIYPLL